VSAASPEKGTEIVWDKFGVIHVYVKNTADLFYGYGYAQAQSHDHLLLHLYGSPPLRKMAAATNAGVSLLFGSISQKALTTMPRGILRQFQQKSKRVLPVSALDPVEHVHRSCISPISVRSVSRARACP
jgi:acyl-homoserine-lactone acylase